MVEEDHSLEGSPSRYIKHWRAVSKTNELTSGMCPILIANKWRKKKRAVSRVRKPLFFYANNYDRTQMSDVLLSALTHKILKRDKISKENETFHKKQTRYEDTV
jgi:hypothetical protein